MKAKYINPFTDFGFKKIFGEEASKPMLIDFLACLIPNCNIVDLSFRTKDKLGNAADDRKAVYDIYCETANGEKIIVELQKAKQKYFKDRTIFYSSFPIQEQAEKGEWNYELKAVYCIGILDFEFEEDKENSEEVIHTVQLKNQHNQVFYNKLKYVYLEMPNFKKTEKDLKTRLDKWLYFIKNLEDFEGIPDVFNDKIFEQAFEKAEIANYTEQERLEYEKSLKTFRDYNAVFNYATDTAFDEGKIEGERVGESKKAYSVATILKLNGINFEIISKSTGLTIKEIEEL